MGVGLAMRLAALGTAAYGTYMAWVAVMQYRQATASDGHADLLRVPLGSPGLLVAALGVGVVGMWLVGVLLWWHGTRSSRIAPGPGAGARLGATLLRAVGDTGANYLIGSGVMLGLLLAGGASVSGPGILLAEGTSGIGLALGSAALAGAWWGLLFLAARLVMRRAGA